MWKPLIGKRPYEEKKMLDIDVDGDNDHEIERGTIDEGVPPYDSSIKAPNMA